MPDAGVLTEPRRSGGRARGALLAVIGLAVSIVALVIVVRSVDLAAAAAAIAHADLRWIALGSVTWTLGLLLRAFRWGRVLPQVDGEPLPVRRLLPPMLVGYLGNAVLPARLGEPIRAYLVSRREDLTFGAALGSVALERIVDTAILAVLAFLAAITVPAAPAWVVSGTGVAAFVGLLIVVLLATVGFGPLLPVARWFLRWLPVGVREGAIGTFERFVYWSGGGHRRTAVLIATAISIVAWITDAATMWFMAQAVGADLPPAGAMLISTITVLSTAIPSAPAYVGTYELAAVSVATAIGVPADLALAMAVLAHAFAVLPSAIGGAIALPLMGRGGLRAISSAAAEQAASPAPE